MVDRVTIHLDGVEGCIASYDHMLMHEPGDFEMDVPPLTPFQYQSILFGNLGYDRCPNDSLWMERGLNVEDVTKSEVLDYPITFYTLRITSDCTLFDLLMVVRNWVRGGLERGRLLDPQRSFLLPSRQEIQYYLQNRIKVKRSACIRTRMDSWDRADVMWRRLYNLVPTKDPEYFEYSLVNFEAYAKQIRVVDPYAAFASAIVDPDLLFSAIRQAEKEAVHAVWNASDKTIPLSMLDERVVATEFAKSLYRRMSHLSRIYRNRGASGFVRSKYKNQRQLGAVAYQPTVGTQIQLYQPIVYGQSGPTEAEQMVLSTIFEQIAATPLDGDHKGFVTNYVEPYSLGFIDALGEDSLMRIATYKRLYYTLDQLKKSNPELLNPKEKFTLSEPFYIDPDRFGLYSKARNRFYIASLDLIVREMSPQEALEYYGVYLGKNVLLDPAELGDTFESPIVDDIDLAAMEMEGLGMAGQQFVVPIPIAPLAGNPNVYQPQAQMPPFVSQNREAYGFSPNLVEG